MESYKIVIAMHRIMKKEPMNLIAKKLGIEEQELLFLRASMQEGRNIDHIGIIKRFSANSSSDKNIYKNASGL